MYTIHHATNPVIFGRRFVDRLRARARMQGTTISDLVRRLLVSATLAIAKDAARPCTPSSGSRKIVRIAGFDGVRASLAARQPD